MTSLDDHLSITRENLLDNPQKRHTKNETKKFEIKFKKQKKLIK